jgi:putative membrane protein
MHKFLQLLQSKPKWFVLVLIIFYLVGMVGMWLNPVYFAGLSSYNLLLTTAILLLFAPLANPDCRRFVVLVAVVGFAVEIIGVKTGKVFGSYYYGSNLGPKMGMVPLIIALNWLILTLSSLSVASSLKVSVGAKVLIGTAFMVGLDLLIEPLSSQLDYWHWLKNEIPFRNFAGWTVVSLFFHATAWQLKFEKFNPVALSLLILQYVFFLIIHLKNFLG